MKKLITFSLWGQDRKYITGAVRNAELAPRVYPGWTCRFYLAKPWYTDVINELSEAGDHVEVVLRDEQPSWMGMFWRFEAASEDDVDVFISRDCDSRLNEREAAAVQEWMNNPHLIHVMRDHPHHTVPILGGIWGAKKHAIPDMKDLISKWNKEDRWQTDQEFLRHVIWPQHYWKVMVHDDWNRFPMPGTERRSFPTPRDRDNFVGAIIGPNEERLHPEHHKML